jgi:hypothetical protein
MLLARKFVCGLTVYVTALCGMAVSSAHSQSGPNLPEYFHRASEQAVSQWLKEHPKYRVLSDDDCRCDGDLAEIRAGSDGDWKGDPAYHPYYMVGDFDGDGRNDLALGVSRVGDDGRYQVLIVDDFEHLRVWKTTFLSQPFEKRMMLFFGAPRPKPYRLVIGAYASEGATFEPSMPAQYRLDWSED